MTRYEIEGDEWYPVYELVESEHGRELDEATAKRWLKAQRDFTKAQKEIAQMLRDRSPR